MGNNDEIYLALAYANIGNILKRDNLLDLIENQIQAALANGFSPRLVSPILVQIESVRGDAKQSSQRLADSIENGYPPNWNELKYYAIYDPVRENPEFQKQMARVKDYEKQIRDRINAEGLW